MRKAIILFSLALSACGGGEGVQDVSRAGDGAYPQGMSYQQFRNHSVNDEGGSLAAQKRFLQLDRDNNGVLSQDEFNGY